jgi:serine/threonine protein kinase
MLEVRRRIFLLIHEGGNLETFLKQHKTLSESQTKFYLGEIILGIQFLHQQGIIYQ